jgi:hypothetical protein
MSEGKEEKLPFEHINHKEKKPEYDCNDCIHLIVSVGKLYCNHFGLEIYNPKKDECESWEIKQNV